MKRIKSLALTSMLIVTFATTGCAKDVQEQHDVPPVKTSGTVEEDIYNSGEVDVPVEFDYEEAFKRFKGSPSYAALNPQEAMSLVDIMKTPLSERDLAELDGVGIRYKDALADVNKPTLVVGAFGYCPACHDLMERLAKDYEMIAPKYNVVFLNVTAPEAMVEYLNKNHKSGLPFKVINYEGDAMSEFPVYSAPSIYVADPEGNILALIQNQETKSLIETADSFAYTKYDASK